MAIYQECKNCGNTTIYIDLERHMAWCSACGETDQIEVKEYDFEEPEEGEEE